MALDVFKASIYRITLGVLPLNSRSIWMMGPSLIKGLKSDAEQSQEVKISLLKILGPEKHTSVSSSKPVFSPRERHHRGVLLPCFEKYTSLIKLTGW